MIEKSGIVDCREKFDTGARVGLKKLIEKNFLRLFRSNEFRVYIWREVTEAEIYRSLPGPNIYNARNLSMRGHNFAPLSRNVIGLEIKQI